MAKKERAFTVDIPRPGDDRPVWSRVGAIAAAGFVIGIIWPRIAGFSIGPNVPEDARPKAAAETASASPSASAAVPVASGAPIAAPAGSAVPAAGSEPPAANQELVTVGPGKITRCSDAKNKKVDDCGELQFDPIALPRLQQLAKCPSALGLEGKLSIGFEVDFKAKEVHVVKGKKTTLPTSTLSGILACAAREFSSAPLEDVPHKYKKYTLQYTASFFPPGKHPEAENKDATDEPAAGSTTSETEATGLATVTWDTALLRNKPKEGDVVLRIVRGTRVKIVGRQNDWYRVESGGKTGWVYRGAIGL